MSLTLEQLERARVLNLYFGRVLSGPQVPTPRAWPSPAQRMNVGICVKGADGAEEVPAVNTIAFAELVAAFQAKHATLRVDGVLGPLTIAKVREHPTFPPYDELWLRGNKCAIQAPVIRFDQPTGLGWDPTYGNAYFSNVHRERLDLSVIHWSETESARQTWQVLIHRHLSCDFALDPDGTIFQFSDPAYCVCKCAGVPGYNVNRRAWNIEMTGGPPGLFSLRAIDSLIKLVKLVSEVFEIPKLLPQADGVSVSARVDRRTYEGFYRGTCGHYHLTQQKTDPGTAIWKHFLDAGWGVG